MKQIIQNYITGVLELAEASIPLSSPDTLLVRNVASLVSIGTERSVIELGQKSLLGKAKARPDLVKEGLPRSPLPPDVFLSWVILSERDRRYTPDFLTQFLSQTPHLAFLHSSNPVTPFTRMERKGRKTKHRKERKIQTKIMK